MSTREQSAYGARLAEARKHAKLTQVQVSAELRISQGTLAELEKKGQGSAYTVRLARLLRCDPYWLETGEGSPGWTDRNAAVQPLGLGLESDGADATLVSPTRYVRMSECLAFVLATELDLLPERLADGRQKIEFVEELRGLVARHRVAAPADKPPRGPRKQRA